MREDDDLFCNMPFNQQMSFACELTLRKTAKGIKLFRWPVREIEKLYTQQFELTDTTLKPNDNPLSGISGDLFDIGMEIEPGDDAQFGVRLHETTITYGGGKVTCLGSTAEVSLIDGSVKLRILVDRASLEVFVNDGEVSMTSIFQPKEKNTGLELYTRGGNVNIRSLRVSKLKSSWIVDQPLLDLFAFKGNYHGLSKDSPWPKFMGNTQNNGISSGLRQQ
jgi:sucrose-6-phosphate hydrolase SacC (GH32 family)